MSFISAAFLPCHAHLQWNPLIGFSLHDGLTIPPPPPKPTPLMPAISFSVLNGVWFGSLPTKGNKAGDVVADGLPMIGKGNDAGIPVPHITLPIPPANLLLPLTILLGSSQTITGSSSVQLPCHNAIWGDSTCAAGCALAYYVGLNLGCADYPYGLGVDFVPTWSTVVVGMSLEDILLAALSVAVQIGVAKLGSVVAGKIAGALEKRALTKAIDKAASEEISDFGKGLIYKAIKESDEVFIDKASTEAAAAARQALTDEAAAKVAYAIENPVKGSLLAMRKSLAVGILLSGGLGKIFVKSITSGGLLSGGNAGTGDINVVTSVNLEVNLPFGLGQEGIVTDSYTTANRASVGGTGAQMPPTPAQVQSQAKVFFAQANLAAAWRALQEAESAGPNTSDTTKAALTAQAAQTQFSAASSALRDAQHGLAKAMNPDAPLGSSG